MPPKKLKARNACQSMATFFDLPNDLIREVLGHLATRSLQKAACTCKRLKALAYAMPLHPVMTVYNQRALTAWLSAPEVASRMHTLRMKHVEHQHLQLRHITTLSSLVVTCGRVTTEYPPSSLTHLHLHMLKGNFSTRALGTMPRLESLTLVATDRLEAMFLQQSPLKYVRLKAWEVHLRCPLHVDTVHVEALNRIVCVQPCIRARTLRVECDGAHPAPLESMVLPADASALHRLYVRHPGCSSIPFWSEMSQLEEVRIKSDIFEVGLWWLSSLPRLQFIECDTLKRVALVPPKSPNCNVRIRCVVDGIELVNCVLRDLPL